MVLVALLSVKRVSKNPFSESKSAATSLDLCLSFAKCCLVKYSLLKKEEHLMSNMTVETNIAVFKIIINSVFEQTKNEIPSEFLF